MRLSSDKAALQAQRAEIQFRDAVYRALADVDNAMRQRLEAQRQIGNQRRHLAMSRQAVALARHQYQAGSVALQTLLDAQEAVLTSENSLSALHATLPERHDAALAGAGRQRGFRIGARRISMEKIRRVVVTGYGAVTALGGNAQQKLAGYHGQPPGLSLSR